MLKDKEVRSFRVSDGNTVRLEYRRNITSTVDIAREYARAGYPDRYVVFAEREGDMGDGLYLSCILRPSIFPAQAGLIGPLAAVAFATALEEHTSKKLGIGWVSDIYCDGIKVGGCSVEGKLDNFTSYEYMIISFAVRLDEKIFPPRLTDMVRTVFEAENASVAMIIAKTVLNRFFMLYRDLKSPEKHMDLYRAKFALIGAKIKYLSDGKKKSAKVIDVDKKNCTLIIETKDSSTIKVTSPSMVIIPNKL